MNPKAKKIKPIKAYAVVCDMMIQAAFINRWEAKEYFREIKPCAGAWNHKIIPVTISALSNKKK